MARYVREGVSVLVATCTGGERGDVLNPRIDLGDTPISAVRRVEMARAAAVLGVDHVWLGFEDSGFPEGDPLPPLPPGSFAALDLADVAEPLVRLFREFRPHVVTTYDENGGYPHPDHIRAHEVTMVAWHRAADESVVTGQQAWAAAKLYYHHAFSRSRIVALHHGLLAAGLPSSYSDWLEDWHEDDDTFTRVTARVPCGDYFGIRDDALRAHATQIDPDSVWFSVPNELGVRIWPTEDFELAHSRLGAIVEEDDLFHGLRTP